MTLRSQLAFRIRFKAPAEWLEFCINWMAFNAIYGGEPDNNERARVMSAIRSCFSKHKAKAVLKTADRSIQRVIQLPPGNLQLDIWDPQFRAASRKYKRIYTTRSEEPVSRLAAVAAILYQVRCNLIHGSKDPDNERDGMLVRESNRVLKVILTGIFDGAATN